MLNPVHIDKIVRSTVIQLGENSPAYARLIKGTFSYESNLEDLYDHSNYRMSFRGLSLISDNRIEEIVVQYARYRDHAKKAIQRTSGISIDNDPLQKIQEAAETNIQLMVALTYYWYQHRLVPAFSDDLTEIAKVYRDYYYIGPYLPGLVEDFVDLYREVYK